MNEPITRETLLNEVKSLYDNAIELMKGKNSDYNTKDDPYGNFKLTETLGVSPTQNAIFSRLLDKVSRLANFVNAKDMKVADEKIEDTAKDLINYTALLVVYLKNLK